MNSLQTRWSLYLCTKGTKNIMLKHIKLLIFSHYFLKILFIYFYREGKDGRRRERKTSMCGCLSNDPYTRYLTRNPCALTGNWTGDPLVHRLVLNPLSHTSQDSHLLHELINSLLLPIIESLLLVAEIIAIGKQAKHIIRQQSWKCMSQSTVPTRENHADNLRQLFPTYIKFPTSAFSIWLQHA